MLFLCLFVRPLKILRTTMRSVTMSLSATRCWKNTREGSTWRVWTKRRERRRRRESRSRKKSTGNTLKLTLRWGNEEREMYGWKDRLMFFLSKTFFFYFLFRVAWISYGRSGKRQMGWIHRSSIPRHSLSSTVSLFVLKQPFHRKNELNSVFSLRYEWWRCVGWARAGGPFHKRGNVSPLRSVTHCNLLLTVMEASLCCDWVSC